MQAEIEEIRRRIEAARKEGGHSRPVTIVAATKTVEPERINLLPGLGITDAGENRVQELLSKYDLVRGVRWHFIGSLQTNKVRQIVDKVYMIHSLDRVALADEIDLRSEKCGKITDVLVEVNAGKEESKGGVFFEDAEALMAYAASKKNLRLRGIMGVFPVGAPEKLYEELFAIYKVAESRYGADVLSAGMSGDYETAVRHGANLVRIGSAIFGQRKY